jgi:hypothetical protein
MTTTIAAACSVMLLTAFVSAQPAPRLVALQELTVPAAQLPDGCALKAETRGTMTVFGFPGNPWIGDDRQTLARMRERAEGSPDVPDGPPLTRAAQARFQARLADGVEEGYSAVYAQAGERDIVVHALRFAPTEKQYTALAQPRARYHPPLTRIDHWPVVVFFYGSGSDCSAAVARHLTGLRK